MHNHMHFCKILSAGPSVCTSVRNALFSAVFLFQSFNLNLSFNLSLTIFLSQSFSCNLYFTTFISKYSLHNLSFTIFLSQPSFHYLYFNLCKMSDATLSVRGLVLGFFPVKISVLTLSDFIKEHRSERTFFPLKNKREAASHPTFF